MDTYHVGTGQIEIKLTADIASLFGVASSRAIVVDLSSEEPGESVGNSNDASGDITSEPIGLPSALAGKRLSVLTRIDLIGTLEERKAEYKKISSAYKLEDGADGGQTFGNATKTAHQNYMKAFLHKKIDLL